MNPLNTVKGSIAVGVVASIIIAVLIHIALGGGAAWVEVSFARWLHYLSGVMWIGLLYYFNAVQIPGLAEAGADKGGPGGAGISKYIAPRALLWFRWAAVVTWVTGVWYLVRAGGLANLIGAFTLGLGSELNSYHLTIGIGAWLGTIMLFNVWVLIWPNQQKVLGLVPATDEEKNKARNVAKYASRTNFVLSIPMLMCMGGASHGLPF